MNDLISRAAAKKIVSLMVCAPSVKITAEHSIDDIPAVDAIPVEWLENRLNTLCFEAMGAVALYGDRSGELAKSINEVMKLWQKEQEAR